MLIYKMQGTLILMCLLIHPGNYHFIIFAGSFAIATNSSLNLVNHPKTQAQLLRLVNFSYGRKHNGRICIWRNSVWYAESPLWNPPSTSSAPSALTYYFRLLSSAKISFILFDSPRTLEICVKMWFFTWLFNYAARQRQQNTPTWGLPIVPLWKPKSRFWGWNSSAGES